MSENKELLEALDPFERAYRINKPLNIPDGTGLSRCLPGIWPTWGEFKRLLDLAHRAAQPVGAAEAALESAESARTIYWNLLRKAGDEKVRLEGEKQAAHTEGWNEARESAAQACDRIESHVETNQNYANAETKMAHSECAALCALSIRKLSRPTAAKPLT